MVMPDINLLVYSHRAESERHEACAAWITHLAAGHEPFALSELVTSGFVRIVTNKKIFSFPSTIQESFDFIQQLRLRPTCRVIRPGPRHWKIFEKLCRETKIRGKLVADAYHAALAIEHGCEWISCDSDFSHFQDHLRWRLFS